MQYLENVVDGVAMMLMAAFIFNIHYPVCAKGYFTFFEKYFLGTQITVSKAVKSLMILIWFNGTSAHMGHFSAKMVVCKMQC